MSKVFVKKMENISFPEKQLNLLINQSCFQNFRRQSGNFGNAKLFFWICVGP